MQRLGIYAVLLAIVVAFNGCTQETQRETREAFNETGQALESAAEDTAKVIEGAVDGASNAVEENRAKPDPDLPE
jgi:PBP1b-binding outer membrane lipoprotein LpoB